VEFPIIEIRKFISDTAKIPYEGKNIYILSGIDTGSLEAMNALLKVLEDTPRHAIILLVVSDRESLLETIHSRTIDLFRSEIRIIDQTHADGIRAFFE
jgi:DNA polymerase III gamma/tau subunit